MNPLCFICEQHATRVCCYANCKQLAFVCSGPCVKSASLKIHTHNDINYFIKCSEVEQRIIELDSDSYHEKQDYLNIQKAVQLLKNELDSLVKTYGQTLQNKIQLIKSQKTQQILQTSLQKLTGGQINHLMSSDQKIYKNFVQNKFMLNQCERIHQETIKSIQKLLDQHKNKVQAFCKKSTCELCLEDNIFVLSYISTCPCARMRHFCYECINSISRLEQYSLNLCQKCMKPDLALQKKISQLLNRDDKQFFEWDKRKKLEKLTNPTVCPNCIQVFQYKTISTKVGNKEVMGGYCKNCQTYFYNCCLAPLSPIESHCSQYHRPDCRYHKYFKHSLLKASPTCSQCKKLLYKQQCFPPNENLQSFLKNKIGKNFFIQFCQKLKQIAIDKRKNQQKNKKDVQVIPYSQSMFQTEKEIKSDDFFWC